MVERVDKLSGEKVFLAFMWTFFICLHRRDVIYVICLPRRDVTGAVLREVVSHGKQKRLEKFEVTPICFAC